MLCRVLLLRFILAFSLGWFLMLASARAQEEPTPSAMQSSLTWDTAAAVPPDAVPLPSGAMVNPLTPPENLGFNVSAAVRVPVGDHYVFFIAPSGEMVAYHSLTQSWTTAGIAPVNLGNVEISHAISNEGEDQFFFLDNSSGSIARLTLSQADRNFGALNYATLGLYLAALVAMGFVFSRRMHSTDDFFKAGGRIPWWAAGVSIFGTQLSAITFMAIPAATYAGDWTRFWGQMSIIAVAPVVVIFFLPFFRRLNVTTAYEYLERRFNASIRMIASALFVLMQFGRIGIVLLLPSMALHVVTGMGIHTCILLMGALCILYTVLGGIEAVIWTDVLQVIVLAGGAVLCLVLMAVQSDGGWDGMVTTADLAGKFRTFDFRIDFTDPVFLVVVLGGFGNSLVSYGSDQAVIQRYLTTPTEADAARGVWMGTLLAIPASLLFFMIGTALFVFYQSHPGMLDPALTKTDYIFPYFITTQLPGGVAGLLIAAVFAASMSSLDSSMNSVSAAFTTDFYRKWRPSAGEAECLRVARGATVVIGVLGTAFAAILAEATGVKSLWDQFNQLLGLFGGALCGLFCLAIFTNRVGTGAALIGVTTSFCVQIAIKFAWFPDLHGWFYGITGITVCIVAGMLASLIVPRPSAQSLDGLNWKHRNEN